MYRSFEVRKFRCLAELSVDSLKSVNLIAGLNGVGKTAFLEALFLHSGGYNAELALRLNALRGIRTVRLPTHPSPETAWDSLFLNFDTSETVEMVGFMGPKRRRIVRLRSIRERAHLRGTSRLPRPSPAELSASGALSANHPAPESTKTETLPVSSEGAQVLELEYEEPGRRGKHHVVIDHTGVRFEPAIPQPPSFQTIFVTDRAPLSPQDVAERFGKLEIRNKQGALPAALKVIEPRLKRIAMVMLTPGQPILHGDIGLARLVPLNLMGDGIVRLANLVLSIGSAEDGVALVDEIENGFHHSVLEKVWQAVGKIAQEFNTQVFATTHSWECIVAAHRAFEKSRPYDFRFLRLQRIGEEIRAVSYDRETLAAAVEMGTEVR